MVACTTMATAASKSSRATLAARRCWMEANHQEGVPQAHIPTSVQDKQKSILLKEEADCLQFELSNYRWRPSRTNECLSISTLLYHFSKSCGKSDYFEGRNDSRVISSCFVDKLFGSKEHASFFGATKFADTNDKLSHLRLLKNCLAMGLPLHPDAIALCFGRNGLDGLPTLARIVVVSFLL